MLEAEEAFVDNIEVLASRIENMIRTVTRDVLDSAEKDIHLAHGKKENVDLNFDWLDKPFPRIPFVDAVEILKKNADKFEHDFGDNYRLNRERELYLVKHFQSPLFIIDWPKETKPFYMRDISGDQNTVN